MMDISQESHSKSHDEVPVLSYYAKNLESHVRERYLKKISVVGVDPAAIYSMWPLVREFSEHYVIVIFQGLCFQGLGSVACVFEVSVFKTQFIIKLELVPMIVLSSFKFYFCH